MSQRDLEKLCVEKASQCDFMVPKIRTNERQIWNGPRLPSLRRSVQKASGTAVPQSHAVLHEAFWDFDVVASVTGRGTECLPCEQRL